MKQLLRKRARAAWLLCLPLAGASCTPLLVFGSALADDAPQTNLADIVVTATRSAQSAFEIPASIDSVYLDDPSLNTPGVNAAEFLGGVPGLLARDRQNYAQDEQISIRGFGARSTFGVRGVRLYADGIPATMPDGQGQISNFSLGSGERIEILRGPFSALYGNSSGGVIQIFTADGSVPGEWRAGIGLGEFGTYDLDANLRGRSGSLGYNVDLSQLYTDGYRDHSRAQREVGNAKFDVHFDGGGKLTLILNAVDVPDADDALGLTRAQFDVDPTQAPAAAVQFDTRKSVHQAQAGAVFEQPLGTVEGIRLMTYIGQRDVLQFQSIPIATQVRPTSPGGVIKLDGEYGGGDARWNYHASLLERPLDVTIGTSYDVQDQHRFGYNNFVGSALGVLGDLRRDEQDDEFDFDQYFQATWDIAERWSMSAGARHSSVRFRADDNFVTATNGNDSGSADYSATTPVAGLLFRAAHDWHLYASYGNGFETPTFNELGYRPDGSAGINFDLIPARSRNGELGSKWRLASGAEFNVDVFRADTRHELAVFTSSGGRTTYQNIDRARRQGVEAHLSYPLAEQVHFEMAYTRLEATFGAAFLTCPAASTCTTPNTLVAAGARIPGVPETDAYAALRFGAAHGWNASVQADAAGDTPVNDLNTQAAPGFAVLNASIGYNFVFSDAEVSTFLRLNNAFDHSYVGSVIVNESNGRYYEPAPARNLFAGVRIDWKR